MLEPVGHLPDSEFHHYCLQLSTYKVIIERNTNIKIGKLYIVWFNEVNDNYKIIECNYYEKEVYLIVKDLLHSVQNLSQKL